MAAPRPFRLAHLSDLHIGPLPRVAPRQLLGKRLLGYLSWRTRKQRLHLREVLVALRCDLQASAPDHVVITGDLVNLALPVEFVQAGAWLRDLGTPEWVSVIPGNHDAYVKVGAGESWGSWADYMRSDEPSAADGAFPYLRRRGPLAIIGLSSAIATPLGFATGRLGARQLDALDRMLAELGNGDCCRVVLLHHPPVMGASGWRKRLIDAAAFRAVVARRGADLILHGHAHLPLSGKVEGWRGATPVLGAPSASSLDGQYRIYEIARGRSGWIVRGHCRAYDRTSAQFLELPVGDPRPAPFANAQPC